MKINHISEFTNGWIIGDFEPTLFRTPHMEVAIHHLPKSFRGIPHTHFKSTEWNYIINGSCIVSDDHVLQTGDIWTYEPGDVSNVLFLEDTTLLVVKSPSLPDDKYEVDVGENES